MKALIICSGSIEYAKAALDLVEERFRPSKIYVVTQREAYERGLKNLQWPYEVSLPTSPSSLLATIKSLRKKDIDLRVSLFTGEHGHGRLKFASLLFGARRKYVYTKRNQLHGLTISNWRTFAGYLRREAKSLLKSVVLAFIKAVARILRLVFFPFVFLYLLFKLILWSARRRLFRSRALRIAERL